MTALKDNGDFGKRLHLYQVVSREGVVQPGGFTTASRAYEHARRLWPDQEQDENRTGRGWDIQIVGVE